MLKQEKSLGHEKNAGAACKKCGPKCEGLDLHFWRKICNNCRCKFEDHQVVIETNVPKKFAKKKIMADEGGKPNFPDKTVSFAVEAIPTKPPSPPNDDEDLPPPPEALIEVENVINQTQGLSMAPVTVSVPMNSENGLQLNGSEAKANGFHTDEPAAENARRSFIFMPDGANEETVSKYLAAIPAEKAPTNETGVEYHKMQMMQQLPAHDFQDTPTNELTENEKNKMMNFKRKRDEEDSGQGIIQEKTETVAAPDNCSNCDKGFSDGSVVILAKLAGPEKCWHPECFVCEICREILVDLIYFHHEGKIYCGRHYGETIGIRCAACDELIFNESYAQAEGKNYHTMHFCCFECDKELAGEKYVSKEDHPYCVECNERKFSRTCHGCGNNIPTNQPSYNYEDFYWHNDPECFSCCLCKISLIGKEFVPKDGNVYCSSACYTKAKN